MSRKAFGIFIGAAAAVIIALIGMNMALDNRKTWDVCYEMANTHVSWRQTFHAGAWDSE